MNYAYENNFLNKENKAAGKEVRSFEDWLDLDDRTELLKDIRDEYAEDFDAGCVLDFFGNVGSFDFERTETVSGDTLTIDIRWQAEIRLWEDIGAVVNRIGYIDNCWGHIKILYLSETGKFYDQEHTLLADDEESFFDYLTTSEFDFHPVIAERTYEMLRFFGWYEGRHIDTTEFNRKMLERGIELTQKQLDFLAEFSGLHFSFKDCYYNWWFYSLDELLNSEAFGDRGGYYKEERELICGDQIDVPDPLSIDPEGIIGDGLPRGRTTMECIDNLANRVPHDVKWLH